MTHPDQSWLGDKESIQDVVEHFITIIIENGLGKFLALGFIDRARELEGSALGLLPCIFSVEW